MKIIYNYHSIRLEWLKWLVRILATLSMQKCKAVHFGFHNPNIEFKLNNHMLEVVHKENDLVVIIDDDVNG